MGGSKLGLSKQKKVQYSRDKYFKTLFSRYWIFCPRKLISIFSLSIGMLCFSDCAFAVVQHFVSANPQIVEPRCKTKILFCPICATIGEIASNVCNIQLHLCIFAIVSNL